MNNKVMSNFRSELKIMPSVIFPLLLGNNYFEGIVADEPAFITIKKGEWLMLDQVSLMHRDVRHIVNQFSADKNGKLRARQCSRHICEQSNVVTRIYQEGEMDKPRIKVRIIKEGQSVFVELPSHLLIKCVDRKTKKRYFSISKQAAIAQVSSVSRSQPSSANYVPKERSQSFSGRAKAALGKGSKSLSNFWGKKKNKSDPSSPQELSPSSSEEAWGQPGRSKSDELARNQRMSEKKLGKRKQGQPHEGYQHKIRVRAASLPVGGEANVEMRRALSKISEFSFED